MADNKIEKALYGPSTTEVALGAVLGLGAGLLAACAFLVFKPVVQVRELPPAEKQVRGAVYYVPGSESGAKSRNWNAKQKQLVAAQSVEVVEDELNAWSASTLGTAGATKPGAEPAADGGIFQPGTPNFQIADGKIRIGFRCLLNWYGVGHEVFVITRGEVRRSGDRFVYVPDTVHLGSCPLHLLPVVSRPLVSHLLSKKKVPDEILSAWAKASDVTIEGDKLKVTF